VHKTIYFLSGYNTSVRKIAVTMGEPGGIGPEVTVKALADPEVMDSCHPVVIGDRSVLEDAVRLANLSIKVVAVHDLSESRPASGRIEVLDACRSTPFEKGAPSENGGRVAVEYVKKAAALALTGESDAIVTAPLSKESLNMAGHSWPGHTELLAEQSGTKSFAMMFVSSRLNIILSTIHVSLRRVPDLINEERVSDIIGLSMKGADMLGIQGPRIAVAGLNPHAGESGIFGNEEIRSIIPAIQKSQEKGINVSGPYPPDVVFYRAYNGDFDMVVCMYHDQGLIPFKMLAFDTGVNVTVGLPIIRTSPDHGTGFDIAWKNMARPSSMIEAIKLATRIKPFKS
jgi:4-hydroxythreonine-4-phosphate dehydrogenase